MNIKQFATEIVMKSENFLGLVLHY